MSNTTVKENFVTHTAKKKMKSYAL